MNKAKKIVSSVLAGVMALSMMSIGASAADDTCGHYTTVKRRSSLATQYPTSHSISYALSDGTVKKDTCSYSVYIYNCQYVCIACGKMVVSAGTETEEVHNNSHCSSYGRHIV